ncbi:hypothetical protein LCGC14_2629240, partial [marine sediment metagenome]
MNYSKIKESLEKNSKEELLQLLKKLVHSNPSLA